MPWQWEISSITHWLQNRIKFREIKSFDKDLADGVTFCALMETLVPGACPRYDLLPSDHPAANLRLAGRLAKVFLGVKQVSH